MSAGLERLFGAIRPPPAVTADKPLYAVMPVAGHESYLIGKDSDARACLLVVSRGWWEFEGGVIS